MSPAIQERNFPADPTDDHRADICDASSALWERTGRNQTSRRSEVEKGEAKLCDSLIAVGRVNHASWLPDRVISREIIVPFGAEIRNSHGKQPWRTPVNICGLSLWTGRHPGSRRLRRHFAFAERGFHGGISLLLHSRGGNHLVWRKVAWRIGRRSERPVGGIFFHASDPFPYGGSTVFARIH